MTSQRNLMIGTAAAVLAGITLTMLGMLQASSTLEFPIGSYPLLAGACACLVAAAAFGFRMVRSGPEAKSKDERV